MNLRSPKKISKSDLMMIADMRGVKVKQHKKKEKLLKKTYHESPFKSIILSIRSILPKKGSKK